jgi:hypothetical protein
LDVRPASPINLLCLLIAEETCTNHQEIQLGDKNSACRAPQLKSLRLISCYKISKHGLKEAIRKLHLLEELEVSLFSSGLSLTLARFFCSAVAEAEILAAAAEACPRLKHLRLNKHRFRWHSGAAGDSEATEIAKMRGLRSLQLFGNSLSNAGLEAILRGCVRLESLDIRHCFNVKMNDEARVMCARLQTLRLPDDSMHGYELSFGRPEMCPAGIPYYVVEADHQFFPM